MLVAMLLIREKALWGVAKAVPTPYTREAEMLVAMLLIREKAPMRVEAVLKERGYFMSKKNENVNPEIAMAKGISDEESERIADAMLDSGGMAGNETAHYNPSDLAKPSQLPLHKGANKNSADEELVELFVANTDVEEGAYFTLSINLKEFKIEFNKPCMVPGYVRDYYYSLNKDIALNNKMQNAFADKNPK